MGGASSVAIGPIPPASAAASPAQAGRADRLIGAVPRWRQRAHP